jgi:hypothetical protein
VLSLVLSSEVRAHQRLREQAGIEVSATAVVPGHPAVRALAESGEPIVVQAAPAEHARPARRPQDRPYRGRPTGGRPSEGRDTRPRVKPPRAG